MEKGDGGMGWEWGNGDVVMSTGHGERGWGEGDGGWGEEMGAWNGYGEIVRGGYGDWMEMGKGNGGMGMEGW